MNKPSIERAILARIQPRQASRDVDLTSLDVLRCARGIGNEDPSLSPPDAVDAVLRAALVQLGKRRLSSPGLMALLPESVAAAARALLGLDGDSQSSGARHREAARLLFLSERQVRRLVPAIARAVADEIDRMESTAPVIAHDRPRPPWWMTPMELLATPGLFVGRDSELTHLGAMARWRARSPARARIIVIHGLPGIGKTTLVTRLAHDLAPDFPDGQFWLALGGTDRVSETSIVRRLLRSVGGVPDIPGTDLPALRSALAGRRVLIVLDGAKDEEQVEAAIPASSAALILVSSRTPLGGLDADRFRVDPLGDDDAVRLLVGVAGRRRGDSEALAQIAQACGNMPFALRMAGARLVSEELAPMDLAQRIAAGGAANELRYGTRRADEFIMSAVALLTPDARSTLRWLVTHGCPPSDLQELAAIAELETVGLLVRTAEGLNLPPIVESVLGEPGQWKHIQAASPHPRG
ncbi:MAG: NB-ARC domain-containing protein [Actinomycetota bacterium]|nr:NB-ARC domain-containing protein [Actinomycetota bacterium]